jgi:hypothetical protein
MDTRFLSVRDIEPGIKQSCIKCRVIYMWCVPSFKNKEDIDSMEIILVDKEVNEFCCLLNMSLFMTFFSQWLEFYAKLRILLLPLYRLGG